MVGGSASAQSLGEIARKERGRGKSHPAGHVYTNEDIARPQILFPQDRTRFEAERQAPGAPTAPEAAQVAAPQQRLREFPLGDVAQSTWGMGPAWTCVAQVNPGLRDPDRVYPGKILRTPPKCGPVQRSFP